MQETCIANLRDARISHQCLVFASLDMRLSRRVRLTDRFSLDVLAEGFNPLNRSNFGVPNNTFGPGTAPNATFGQPTQAFDPRQFQFGFKLSF